MKKINLNVSILAIFIIISSCKKNDQMLAKTDKFEWTASAGASEIYPMEIVSGSFIASDESSQWIPNGEYLKAGWGNGNGVWAVGEDMRKIPKQIELMWFSYTENKFYTGNFELPQQKIYDLFKKKYGKNKQPDGSEFDLKFTEITIGLAPKGLITVWLSGFSQLEIGTYQAHEIDIEWKKFYRGEAKQEVVVKSYQKDMLPFVQKEIAEGKISNTYIKNRLQRYYYTITTNKPEEYIIYGYDSSFLNHEVINTNVGGITFLTDKVNGKGMATNGSIHIKDKFGRQLEVRFDANLLENQKLYVDVPPLERRNKNIAYMKLWKDFFEKNKDVQFQIKFDKQIEKSSIANPVVCGKIVLKSATDELVIPNSRVEVFDAEE